MDTTDPEIQFDENGVCSHCRKFETTAQKFWFPNENGRKQLEAAVERIKNGSVGKKYDCIIGLSGGVDSSYLAYQASKLGLRILAVHVDGGWNSEIASKNIENICRSLGIDLHTYVVNWEEMRDLQLAFLRSGVENQDIPQDHVFVAAVHKIAAQYGIKYMLNGSNIATESILPAAWGYNSLDLRHIKAIHRRFGRGKLKTFPTISFFKLHFYYPYIKHIKVARLLNYMPYNKEQAMRTLEKEVGWRYYGGKHYESRFTHFFQGYYLPVKYGYDKRRAHLSSLIVSGQMTRDQALTRMQQPRYLPQQLQEDKTFVIKKLGLTEQEFDRILSMPNKSYRDYPSNLGRRKFLLKIVKIVRSLQKSLFRVKRGCTVQKPVVSN